MVLLHHESVAHGVAPRVEMPNANDYYTAVCEKLSCMQAADCLYFVGLHRLARCETLRCLSKVHAAFCSLTPKLIVSPLPATFTPVMAAAHTELTDCYGLVSRGEWGLHGFTVRDICL